MCILSHMYSLSHNNSLNHKYSLSQTYSLSHKYSLKYSLKFSLTLKFSLSHKYSLSHNYSLKHSLSHKNSLTHATCHSRPHPQGQNSDPSQQIYTVIEIIKTWHASPQQITTLTELSSSLSSSSSSSLILRARLAGACSSLSPSSICKSEIKHIRFAWVKLRVLI